jgi:hypothetical protein
MKIQRNSENSTELKIVRSFFCGAMRAEKTFSCWKVFLAVFP